MFQSSSSGGGSGSILVGEGGVAGLNNRLRYKCEECGKAFITPSKLQRHSYSHSGLRPFQCNICAKSFSQTANLKTHIKNTHPEVFTAEEQHQQSLTSSQGLSSQATLNTFAAAAAAAIAAVAKSAKENTEDSVAAAPAPEDSGELPLRVDLRDPHEPDY